MVKTRIAPSPTGAPHIGTAYVALFNWAFARQKRGKFLLRIEDTDQKRKVAGAERQILDSLEWLGLKWDEGPIRQSERLKIYQKHAERLVKEGKAYYCFCSPSRLERVRKAAQKKGLPPRYDGHCRRLSKETVSRRAKKEEFVVRLKVPKEGETVFKDLIRGEIKFENRLIDDQVLLKSDGFPTYHLAVVVDDHEMGVTHIMRGEEWISSTPKHVILYKALGWSLPIFAHLPILRETDRAKLSKRHGAVSILEFRQEGYLPEALLNFLSLLGWSHPKGAEMFSLDEFIKTLNVSRISTSAPVFDRRKLAWLNGEYIRDLTNRQLANRLKDYFQRYRGSKIDDGLLVKIVPLVRERIKKLSEFEGLAGFFFKEVVWTKEKLVTKGESVNSVSEKLEKTTELFEKSRGWSAESLEEASRRLAKENNWKPAELFMVLRIAATGQEISPPLFESLEILGKERTLRRMERALSVVKGV
ncbi:glutamate--tRNA ligase [Candidatus Saccharibacteria bacterium]|nr:glutamate--tRNA ligase [Candidatus Saccharibacteria bacterium]